MKRTTVILIAAIAILSFPMAALADDGGFAAKCKMCHGADGRKLAKADLSSAAVQGKDDATLVKFLTTDSKHKTKVADAAAAKALVTFLRTLKK